MSDPTTQKADPASDSAAFAEAWDAPQKAALEQGEIDRLTDDIIEALKTVFDPEIPVDIYELGLIYKVDIDDDRKVDIEMTLTAPGCPVAGDMPGWVENAARGVEGVKGLCHHGQVAVGAGERGLHRKLARERPGRAFHADEARQQLTQLLDAGGIGREAGDVAQVADIKEAMVRRAVIA